MLQELVLHEFRNYPHLEHRFRSGLNIFVGKNGSGKTNLLEAIHFILHGQSFRNVKQHDLSRNHQGTLSIKLKWLSGKENHNLSVIIQGQKKKILFDNKPWNEKKFFHQPMHQMKVIFFSSQDIDLILLSPSKRRGFFDKMMSSLKEEYRRCWEEYRRLLQHRNHELSKLKKSNIWDEKLMDYGQRIITMRVSFLKAIAVPLKRIFFVLSRNRNFCPQIAYCCNGEILTSPLSIEVYREKFYQYLDHDNYRGFTYFGPHSDDYFFIFKIICPKLIPHRERIVSSFLPSNLPCMNILRKFS